MKQEEEKNKETTKEIFLNKVIPSIFILLILTLIMPFVIAFLFDVPEKALAKWGDWAGSLFGIFLLCGMMVALFGLSVFLLWKSIRQLSWFYFLYFLVVFSFFGILFLSSFDQYSNMGRWKPIYPINITQGNTFFFVKTLLKIIIVSIILVFISAIISNKHKIEKK